MHGFSASQRSGKINEQKYHSIEHHDNEMTTEHCEKHWQESRATQPFQQN